MGKRHDHNSSTSNSTSTSPPRSSTTAATCDASRSSSDDGTKISIGAGLGVPLLIAFGLLFRENRKRRQAEALIAQQQGPGDYMQQRHDYEAVRCMRLEG